MTLISMDIDRLIGERGAQDPAVLEGMVAEYSAQIYRLALSILCDPADAHDAAQSTFIHAAASIHQYHPGTNFKAWLMKVAVNNCRSILRKRASRKAIHDAWQTLDMLNRKSPGVEAQVIAIETGSELWGLVNRLDEKHRLVVILRLVHDLTIHDISQVLGINEKTVYSRLYDALVRLRGQIRLHPELEQIQEG